MNGEQAQRKGQDPAGALLCSCQYTSGTGSSSDPCPPHPHPPPRSCKASGRVEGPQSPAQSQQQ